MRYNTHNTPRTYEGERAFARDAREELLAIGATSFMEDKFYTSREEVEGRISSLVWTLISQGHGEFVVKLATYLRNVGMRSFPLYLMATVVRYYKGKINPGLVRRGITSVIQRADELAEFLAVWNYVNSEKANMGGKQIHGLPHIVRRGVAEAFHRFDEYQFAKYKSKRGRMFSLQDAIRIVHPKPRSDAESELFRKIAHDELTPPDTWEVKLSAAGSDPEAKRAVWERLIREDRLGYLAMLRNLRNILEAGVSEEALQIVEERIKDPARMGKTLPFRIYAAYLALPEDSPFDDALEGAIAQAAGNFPVEALGRTLVAVDTSGSMQTPLSGMSSVYFINIATLFGAIIAQRVEGSIVGAFADRFRVYDGERNIPVLELASRIQAIDVGWSTHAHDVIRYALANPEPFKTIIILTDFQVHEEDESFEGVWREYKSSNPHTRLITVDLAGYRYLPLQGNPERGEYLISGWSDKVLDMIQMIEDSRTIIREVMEIEL